MSNEGIDKPIQAGEQKEEIIRVMYIMILWIIGVILAGILLVILSDPFAAIFSVTGLLG